MLSRRLLRIKVVKSVYAHFTSESDSLIVSEKNLVTSVDKTYDLYHQVLWLIVDVMRYAENMIEFGRKKKLPTKEDLNPNTKFIDNQIIRQIEVSEELGNYLDKKGLGWVNNPELIRSLYNGLLEEEFFKQYMENPKRTYTDDRQFVREFFMNLEDNEQVETVMEEQSIFWVDDLNYALILAVRTAENMRQNADDIPILRKFKNQDDIDFYKELFRKTIVNFSDYQGYIEQFTDNWDLDRIAFMDNVIMATAIAEFVAFPSIPVKVTLNEYIEISKYYSTRGSSTFINGVLDKVVDVLTEKGEIVKTGRGLL